MSLNRYKPHIFVLPEDDANRQIADGFILHHPTLNQRVIQVLPVAGGWPNVIKKFKKDHIREMEQFSEERLLLLIDFDKREDRLSHFKDQIPENLKARVFILGVFSHPEKLRNEISKSFEEIGKNLADHCADNTNGLWEHDLLQHNKAELERMASVKIFLFN